jgi:hypothetical protein
LGLKIEAQRLLEERRFLSSLDLLVRPEGFSPTSRG